MVHDYSFTDRRIVRPEEFQQVIRCREAARRTMPSPEQVEQVMPRHEASIRMIALNTVPEGAITPKEFKQVMRRRALRKAWASFKEYLVEAVHR